ncbi:MAG TPA: tetratricopeptide repeat protein, partial [Pirellulales bacterium]
MRLGLPGFRFFCPTLLAASVVLSFAALAHAENEGQDDLDKAFDKKLSANSVSDLGEVVDLCESAVAKGLDANNTASANKLLVGTLMQRSNVFTKAILGRTPGWGQLRIQAISDLEKALKVDPKLAMAELGIARLQALPGGDHAEAVKAAEKAVELTKNQHEDEADALLMLANLSDSPEKQLDLFNQAIKVAPRSAAALRERGTFYFLSGKTEEAIADLDAAAKIDPENPELQEARGSAYLRLKKIDKAIEAFGDLIKIDPDQPLPYLQRAFIYAQDKQNDKALDDIAQALKKNDSDKTITVKGLLLRAQIHQQAGDKKAARADLDEALKEKPQLQEALEWRAVLSANSGDYDQAIADFEDLRKIAPKNPELLSQLAVIYDRNKQPRKAIELYG